MQLTLQDRKLNMKTFKSFEIIQVEGTARLFEGYDY